MPRLPRQFMHGGYYHITARGNNREQLFFDQHDHQEYLRRLAELKREFKFEMFAYCLMSNHLHLGLHAVGSASLSTIMQRMQAAYTQYVNHRHGRVGHAFQGRFHSRAIHDMRDVLVVSRYIHLNPVRAGMVPAAETYPWSSYRAYLDPIADHLSLVTAGPVLALVGAESVQEQRMMYQNFMALGASMERTHDMPEILRSAKRGRPTREMSTQKIL
jgi:putative transposase